LIAHIYLDETDLEKIAVGKSVTITFDAYPNTPVEGQVILVEPALQNVDGSSVVAAWATFTAPNVTILSGMNFEAEVIAGEARDALIIPKQALRELEPGSFAVFIVAADGQLLLTPVEVGLMDYANAEILSGLNVGDIVSTGNVETK
jgi:multidrug efflux pump subunit AcrA (membrane-fusion protein)